MKRIVFLFLLFPFLSFAQLQEDERRAIDQRLYPGGDVQSYDLRTRKKVTRSYLFDDYREGKFVFNNGVPSKRTFPIKYDILNQEVIVKAAGVEFAVPMDSLYGFIIEDYYKQVNGEEGLVFAIRKDKGANKTIYEIAADGKQYKLLVGHYAKKLKPNYNAALDTGTLDERIVKKTKFYFMNDKGDILELPKKKKAAKEFFERYGSARKYLSKSKVDFKSKESLSKLVLFMNNYQKK